MKLHNWKWKMLTVVISMCFWVGCGKNTGMVQDPSETIHSQTITSEAAEDSTQLSEETPQEESQFAYLLEIENTNKRYSEAYKLLKPNLEDIEQDLEQNLELLWIMADCKKAGTRTEILLSDTDIVTLKQDILEKVAENHGKNAIVYLDVDDRKNNVINIFDDYDRLVYYDLGKNSDVYLGLLWADGKVQAVSFSYNVEGMPDTISAYFDPSGQENNQTAEDNGGIGNEDIDGMFVDDDF